MAKVFIKVILFLWIFYICQQKYVDGAATGFKQELHVRFPRQVGNKSLFERQGRPSPPQKKSLKLQCREYEDINEIPKASARSLNQGNIKLRRHLIYDYLRSMLERVQTILKAFAEYRAKIPEIAKKIRNRQPSNN